MVLTQDYVDSRISLINRALAFYRQETEREDLRFIPEDRRIVFVEKQRVLEDKMEQSLENAAAFFHLESGRIYFVEEQFSEYIQRARNLLHQCQGKAPSYEDVRDFTFLSTLMHENVHRSARRIYQNAKVRETFLYAAEVLFEENEDIIEALTKVRRTKGKMRSFGLRFDFNLGEGEHLNLGYDTLDEFMADWIATQTFIPFSVRQGYFNARDQATLAMTILRAKKEINNDFFNALKTMSDFSDYYPFVEDYLKGTVSQKLNLALAKEMESETEESFVTQAIIGMIVGDLEFLPTILKVLY
jgi:hypothetical protein